MQENPSPMKEFLDSSIARAVEPLKKRISNLEIRVQTFTAALQECECLLLQQDIFTPP